jgi:CcmD family protein
MTWLFAGYAVVWIALFAYIVRLAKMQRALKDDIASLKEKS